MKIKWLIAVEGNKCYLQLIDTDDSTKWGLYSLISNLHLEPNNSELVIPGRSTRTEVDLLLSLGYTNEQLWDYYIEYRDSVVGNARSR